MQRRLRRPTRISAAIILAGVVPIVPFLHGRGVALVPTSGAFLLFALGLRVKPRLPYAQAWSLLAAAGGCVCATAALMLGDPHHLANLALPALPVVSVGARYPRRVMGVFAAFVCVLLLGAALVDANAVVHQPLRIAVPLLVIGTTALFSRAVGDAKRHFRSEALLDPLTGLFARRAGGGPGPGAGGAGQAAELHGGVQGAGPGRGGRVQGKALFPLSAPVTSD